MLGPVGIHAGDRELRCGAPQQQATLAVLAFHPGRAVPLHELMEAVWGEEPPVSANKVLRTYVWRLRKLIAGHGGDPGLLDSAGDGYRLAVRPEQVDACRAEQGGRQAARASEAGRYDDCAEHLVQALALWRGEPLAGVPGPFAEGARSRLEELQLTLREERFRLEVQQHRHTPLVPELTSFIREHPLREGPYGTLMQALFASGRQADALAVFGRARAVLGSELGLDPGVELRTLHERILGGDPDLIPAKPPSVRTREPVRGSAPVTVVLRPAQLPSETTDFTGRAEAVDTLCPVLTGTGCSAPVIVSVGGMGGMGKSALALRVAHRVKDHFPDGHLYVDLQGAGPGAVDPGTVLESFLTALGVARQDVPASLEDRARLYRTVLDGRRVLLVFDDARDSVQIAPLLPGEARCAVLVTGRTRLSAVAPTVHVQLTEFSSEEALALVRRIVGPERISAEEAAARALVAACAHLPLAVRIVAARLAARPGWTVAHLLGRLADERRRLSELRTGALAVAAVFELGHHQLAPAQSRAFRLLATIAVPDVGLAAGAAVLGLPEAETEELLESLVDIALMESPAPGRYRYHDLVRDFAVQLSPSGTSAEPGPDTPTEPDTPAEVRAATDLAVLGRLLDHLLEGAVEAFQLMVPGDPVRSMLPAGRSASRGPRFRVLADARAWVVAEFDCAIHAVRLLGRPVSAGVGPGEGTLTDAADLLVALGAYGQEIPYTHIEDVARTLAEVASTRQSHRAAGRAHFICGNAALQATRLPRAGYHTQRAAEACRLADDRPILQQTYNDLGVIALFEGDHNAAAEHFDRAVALARELGHRSGELITTLNASLARTRGGRAEEALPVCDGALAALREVADRRGIAYALCARGQALQELGRYEDALSAYQECLDVGAAAGLAGQRAQARYRRADTLLGLGRAAEAAGEAEQAVAYYGTVLDRDRDRGYALLSHARALLAVRESGRALEQARAALEVFTRAGLPETEQARRLIGAVRTPPS
ncbi:BTAD domain-containing putative transcriptional regulator [Streptomyces sp. NPDC048442]|uniref:AfsR/SARP family transcriptional regulator n=1 Tax=Streptomyces sp. NPDC048442 TaxID=3154823 RepID=UPI003424B347